MFSHLVPFYPRLSPEWGIDPNHAAANLLILQEVKRFSSAAISARESQSFLVCDLGFEGMDSRPDEGNEGPPAISRTHALPCAVLRSNDPVSPEKLSDRELAFH